MPNSMQAVEITKFGGPEVLQITTRPRPIPQDGEVLIRVHAAGINRPDLLQRQGHYPPPPGASDLPGLEVAGEIVESRSPEWQPGDNVCALLTGGGYAEYAVAPGGQCLPIPKNFSMVEAAALPEGLFTIWNNLFLRGALKSGELALIHGGTSGIGTMAIQLAHARGARVATTCGSAEKCTAAEKLGATLAINYKSEDFVARIEDAFGKNAINVVLDIIGGNYVNKNLKLLAPEGRHISIAVQGGRMAEIDILAITQKRLTLTGSALRPCSVADKTAFAQDLRREVWPLLDAGKIKPVIYKTFFLAQASDAHAALEKGDHIGKIILICL